MNYYPKYRRPDQYYADQFDRKTIAELKELENAETEPLKYPEIRTPEKFVIASQYRVTSKFYNAAVRNAKVRDAVIKK